MTAGQSVLELAAPSLRRREAGGSGRRRRSGRWMLILVAAGLLGVGAATTVLPRLQPAPGATICGTDQVQARAVAGLADFAGWLQANQVPGYIGEVGWPTGPDADRWAAVADLWYRAADRIGLPVTAWAAGRWPADYPMALYRASAASTSIDSAGPQSAVVESHPGGRRALRGVVVATGSFGTSAGDPDYSAANPGRYGHDYSYENRQTYRYLAGRGVRLVRLAVAWERLQPAPGAPLRAVEVGRLRRAIGEAHAAGLSVVLDLHGYGEFVLAGPQPGGATQATARTVLTLGSPQLPVSALANFWSRVSRATSDLPGLVGYDLLNEPARLAERGQAGSRLWELASQQALDAIRATGNRSTVFVSAYGQTSTLGWSQLHDRPWVHDPAGRVVYEAHVYFDADGSGRYAQGYSGVLSAAAADDVPRCHRLPELSRLHDAALGRGHGWFARLRLFGASGPNTPPARTQAGSIHARMPVSRTSAAPAGALARHEGRQSW
jgi:hypothetical protein